MAKLFGAFGQRAAVQSEPAKFFHYPNALAGTIKIGIDNPVNRTFHNSFNYTHRDCNRVEKIKS
jgi:hypothetical protein